MTKSENLDFQLGLDEIEKDGKAFSISATEAERDQLVERFKIVDLDSLEAAIEVCRQRHGDGIEIKGNLKAALTQQCVVTLGDVPETIDEDFELLLVSPEQADAFDEDEVYADPEAPDYDALEGDTVYLGEVVAQTLSVLMNPYPRVVGAEVKPVSGANFTANEEVGKKPNPFAALAELRDKS